MAKIFRTKHGYITIPQAANKIIKSLNITDDKNAYNYYYRNILKIAKKGGFKSESYSNRMLQVNEQDINVYIDNLQNKSKNQLTIDNYLEEKETINFLKYEDILSFIKAEKELGYTDNNILIDVEKLLMELIKKKKQL